MKYRLFLIRTCIAALLLVLLAWDLLSGLRGHRASLPHRDLLLSGALLWIMTLFFPQQSDDDWAGQF